MQLKLDKRFTKNARGKFEKYQFEVGVLEDSAYKIPRIGKRGLKGADVITQYAGGPVRKKTGKDSGHTVSDISKSNRERLGFNYLLKPFEKRTMARNGFTNAFLKLVFGLSNSKKRCENLLQAIVRNPILRGEYGSNSALTQKIKGFNRPMIDTAQLFKSLKAKCKVKNV